MLVMMCNHKIQQQQQHKRENININVYSFFFFWVSIFKLFSSLQLYNYKLKPTIVTYTVTSKPNWGGGG